MRFASPPVTGIVYRSPSSSSTTVCPSGDTSSEIQVPSDVVKSTLQVGFKGNESGRWAARGRQRATAARSIAVESLRITGLQGGRRRRAENEAVNLEAPSTRVKPGVDKSGPPGDHPPRAITNQRLFL